MTLPLRFPATELPPPTERPARALALWLGLGVIAVVLAAIPSTLFDLDRFGAPKELALHLTALGAVILMLRRAPARISVTVAEVPLYAFGLWTALSALLATNRWLSMRALAVTLAGLVLFRAARRVSATGAGNWLLPALVLALVLGALTGLAQAYGFEPELLAESRAPGGTLGNRNFLAHLMAIGAPIAGLLVLEARGPRRAALFAGGLGLMLGALVLTRSRAAYLGVTAGAIVMGLAWLAARLAGRRFIPMGRPRLMVAAVLLVTTGALLLPNRLTWRSASPYRDTMRDLANYQEGSGRGRIIQYRNSLKLLGHDPIFGAGPGNWPVAYPRVTTPGDPSFAGADPMPTNPWPSSDWIAMLTERGAAGTLLLLLSFAAMALVAFRRLTSDDAAEARRALALLGVLAATVVTGAFDAVLLLAPPTAVVWVALGLLLPATGSVGELPRRTGRWMVPLLGLGLSAAALRSTGQIRAIQLAGPGWPVERLERAVRYDPGSYRLHLMIAQRTPCHRAVPHAAAAAALYPELPAPKRRLRACGLAGR
ncbi:MAG: hypothetical protein HOP28_04155 [Gemmatimonadales bacterium]|nr:hypothetical protein [Gemmatimonadales bacterium]